MNTELPLVDLNNPAQVFKNILLNAIKNIIFYGAAALVIAYIINGLEWRIFGFTLAILFSLILGFGIIKFVLMDFPIQILGIITAFIEKIQGKSNLIRTQIYLLFGTFVLFIENSICFIYLLYLYNAYYKVDLLGIF